MVEVGLRPQRGSPTEQVRLDGESVEGGGAGGAGMGQMTDVFLLHFVLRTVGSTLRV